MRVRFGTFTLDSGRRELRRGDTPVPLPGKAFQLLELLVARAPEAIAQEELYDALWPDAIVEKKNLHNLIYQVRTALDDGDHEIVRTSYGFGFSFAAPVVDVEPKPFSSAWQIVIGDVEFDLREGENLVGRERDAVVRIDSPSMSRHHARLIVSSTGVAIEDLGSKNGTYVGGRRVRHLDRVEDGAQIVFGTIAARLRSVRPSRSTETVR